MKSKIERMKTTGIGIRTIALMLFFVMLLTAIGSGSVFSAIAAEIDAPDYGKAVQAAATEALGFAKDAISEPAETEEADTPANAEAAEEPAPAEDEASKPDLSGFEENAIVTRMKDDVAGLGASADLASTGETGHKIYMCPHNLGYDSYSYFKVWVKDNGGGQGQKDYSVSMSKCANTINGHDVYEADIYEYYGGWSYIQFWPCDSSWNKLDHYDVTNGTWVYASGIENKVYNGYSGGSHHWDTVTWDRDDVYVTGTFNSWSTSTTKMTCVGTNDYTASVNLTSTDRFKFYVNGYDQKYWGHGEAGHSISLSTWGSDLNHANGGQDINAPSTAGEYTLHFDPSAKKAYAVLVAPAAASYYLTGWLNNAEETGNTYAFTNTSGSTWTYTFNPSADNGGYQYFTIKKSDGTAYHPASHNSSSGTAGSNTDTSPGGDNKWRCAAVSGQTVTLTWDDTTHVLSWTVSGGGSSSSWKYTGNNADATPEWTNSPGDYRFVWADNDDGPGKSGTTAIVPGKDDDHGYWADITSYCKSNNNLYIALSNNSSNSGIRGNKSEQINDTYVAGGNTVTMMNGSNETIFYVEMKERSSVSGSAHYLLIRGVDWTKITAVGVQAYYNSGTYVDYKFYYKEKTSGGETVTNVTVYAKDGAAPINWDNKGEGGASDTSGTKYNYAAIATTTISKIDGATPASGVVTTVDCGNSSSQYQTASVQAGKSIQVKTTIASSNSWRSKYYVKGWCINGVTYKCDGTPGVNAAGDTSSGVCTLNYTIPSEPDEEYLEITPIYYLRSNTNCVTFFLEGYNTVMDKWGNTPYVYPFYGDLSGVDNSFGVYPGQPLVYADGQYSAEIPITNNPIKNATSNTKVKGITISNGYADHVHRNMIYMWTDHDNDAEHRQTYDYDDFYKIYEECLKNAAGESAGNPNAIIFRIKDESKTYNRYTYGGSNSGARVIANKSTLSSTDLSNINTNNGWELLKDRYDQPIDLFGNVVTAPSTAATAINSDTVRVISTGYNANIAGDYGTAWKVYQYSTSSQYSLIQDTSNGRYAAPPSIFFLRGNASGYDSAVASVGYPAASHSVEGVGSYTDNISKYEGIYKTAYANLRNKPVYITYEKDAQDTRSNSAGTGAYRLDGRWYYTHDSDYVQSTTAIQYWNNTTGKWADDTLSDAGVGTTTGCTAAFSNNSNNSKTSSSVLISSNSTWTYSAVENTGWVFDGWYIKYSDTSYDKIVGAGLSGNTIAANKKYELVARFYPTVTGSLTIDHNLSASSTGAGTVDMTVHVKNGGTTLATYNGSHIYIDGTYISNSHTGYTIDVTLKTTPIYDGTVSAFSYDSFNTANSITATTSPAALPGGENTLTTSNFTFTVGQLYAGSTLTTSTLLYTSLIDETPHYYNFVYNFTDRSGAAKSYTAKGEISQKDYEKYCTSSDDHTLDNSIISAKAPFESNFLKQNTLSKGAITYGGSSDHTFTATSTFTQSPNLPKYTVKFKLPYDYYTTSGTADGVRYKKYTAQPNSSGNKVYNSDKTEFEVAAYYDQFVTVGATETEPGAQTNVTKVTDPTDINHAGNNFFTAADTLTDSTGATTYYFQYWEIRTLADSNQGNAPIVSKIYYPDLNYRIYGNYYIEAKYSTDAANYWHNTYTNSANDSECSALYLGDSRNQWNNGSGSTSTSSDDAADKIYNDFMFAFNDKGAELKGSTDVKIGYVIERVVNESAETRAWATGSSNVSDMNTYRATYGSTEGTVKTAILSSLSGKSTVSGGSRAGCVFIDLSTSNLNNRNYIEDSYSVFSRFGQVVDTNSIEYQTDNAIDNYVYRVYAVMKNSAGAWVISDPAYFCMRYTANLNYSE